MWQLFIPKFFIFNLNIAPLVFAADFDMFNCVFVSLPLSLFENLPPFIILLHFLQKILILFLCCCFFLKLLRQTWIHDDNYYY